MDITQSKYYLIHIAYIHIKDVTIVFSVFRVFMSEKPDFCNKVTYFAKYN